LQQGSHFSFSNFVRVIFVCESTSRRTRNDRLAHEPVPYSDLSGVESGVERKRPAILQISRGILVLYACVVKCLVCIQVCAVFCAWCHGQATSTPHYCAPVDLARTDSFPTTIPRPSLLAFMTWSVFFDSDECKITELSRLSVVGRRLSFMSTVDFNIN